MIDKGNMYNVKLNKRIFKINSGFESNVKILNVNITLTSILLPVTSNFLPKCLFQPTGPEKTTLRYNYLNLFLGL